jgi:hypothetical protein
LGGLPKLLLRVRSLFVDDVTCDAEETLVCELTVSSCCCLNAYKRAQETSALVLLAATARYSTLSILVGRVVRRISQLRTYRLTVSGHLYAPMSSSLPETRAYRWQWLRALNGDGYGRETAAGAQ